MIYYEDCLIGESPVLCAKKRHIKRRLYLNYLEKGRVFITDTELKDHTHYVFVSEGDSMLLISPVEKINIKRIFETSDELIMPLLEENRMLKTLERDQYQKVKELVMDLELANNKFEHAMAYFEMISNEK